MIRKILFSLLIFSAITLNAQKQEYVGFGVNGDNYSKANMRIGVGFSYENRFKIHHGFGVEINYRNKTELVNISYPSLGNRSQTFLFREDYLSFPLMYKYYSNIVNVSTGVNFDYFVGWKDLTRISDFETTSYGPGDKLRIGWFVRVGKSLQLSPKFHLEPEIYFNPIFSYYYSFYGISMKLKYKL